METSALSVADDFRTQSDNIGKIALALSKAQAKMTAAKRTAKNPFFNSSYADLSDVWDAVREPLAEQELAAIQTPVEDTRGTAIITTLAHSSGEWFRSKLYIVPKARDAQSVGSAITYARRYALSAITGVASDDDDGNKAAGQARTAPLPAKPAQTVTAPAQSTVTVASEDLPMKWNSAQEISEITKMLAKLNGADSELMDNHLKTLTLWTPKGATEQKWLTMADLPGIGSKKPEWLHGVFKKVTEDYQRAVDEKGNPR